MLDALVTVGGELLVAALTVKLPVVVTLKVAPLAVMATSAAFVPRTALIPVSVMLDRAESPSSCSKV